MKKVFATTGNLISAALLTVLPLIIAMAASMVATGSFETAFDLSMILLGIGAAITVFAFRRFSKVEMPREQKCSGRLMVWYTMLGFFSTLMILCIIMHGASEDPELNLTKQLNAMLIAPVVEELICRYLLTNIIKDGSKSKAIAVFTALFTTIAWVLPHCHSGLFLNTRLILLGLLSSLIYQKTGSLRACIFEHAASNAAVTLVLAVGLPMGSMPVITVASVITAVSVIFLAKEIAKEFSFSKKAVEINVLPVGECR